MKVARKHKAAPAARKAPAARTAADKKLFPIHSPLSHVDIELCSVHSMFGDMIPLIHRAQDEIGSEGDCWLVALEAMAQAGEHRAEKTLEMLHAAQRIHGTRKARKGTAA